MHECSTTYIVDERRRWYLDSRVGQALPLSLRERTITDPERPSVHVWLGHDPVIQLREWATDTVHPLPRAEISECVIGSELSAQLRLVDISGLVSRKHARLVRDGAWWRIEDLRSKRASRDGELGEAHHREWPLWALPGDTGVLVFALEIWRAGTDRS